VTTSLDLHGNHLADEGTIALARALRTSAITTLNLGANRMSEAGLVCCSLSIPRPLGGPLTACSLLAGFPSRDLWVTASLAARSRPLDARLAGCSLLAARLLPQRPTDRDSPPQHALVSELCSNTTLTSLDLSHNELGSGGGVEVAKLLRANRSLAHLHLSSCELGDVGWRAIAAALPHNTAVTRLVGEPGVATLFEKLRGPQPKPTLDVSSPALSHVALFVLGGLLATSAALTALTLQQTRLSVEAIDALAFGPTR
jgi:hypothetical protein